MLDGLHAVFVLLKERIEQHRGILSRSETQTRYALIDPLLAALGWDITNPEQVQVEYNTQGGYADYALFAGHAAPQAVVEAKKLDRHLGGASEQAIAYCVGQAIPWFVVTNGERWIAYDTFKRVPTQEKRVAEFSLSDEPNSAMIKALWLWRGNFEAEIAAPPSLVPEPESTPIPSVPVSPVPVPSDPSEVPLSRFETQVYQRPPTALTFPDGVIKQIRHWRGLRIAVVEWLTETGRLSADDCPVLTANGAHLVHVSPTRANGSHFSDPLQVNGLWIEGFGDAVSHPQRAKQILQARGVDPATVRVVPQS